MEIARASLMIGTVMHASINTLSTCHILNKDLTLDGHTELQLIHLRVELHRKSDFFGSWNWEFALQQQFLMQQL